MRIVFGRFDRVAAAGIIGVHHQHNTDLAEVAGARLLSPEGLGTTQRRQKHARKQGENRNHDQKLNQGEGPAGGTGMEVRCPAQANAGEMP
jgi:hypothetical protein